MTPDTVRLAVLGDPLRYTLSPELHRAGCESVGLRGESQAIRTPAARLGEQLTALAAQGVRGVNLTHPLKADALRYVPRVSDRARAARSINTIGFDAEGWWGETTDGDGFLDLLRALERDPALQRTVVLGAGGSARSLALALAESGAAPVTVAARDPEKRARAWSDVAAHWVTWRSPEERSALSTATLVVNCTPLSTPDHIAPLEHIPADALLVDLVYESNVTAWVRAARRDGRQAVDGLGLLVHQARRSLTLWLGREVAIEPLERAVGWPR